MRGGGRVPRSSRSGRELSDDESDADEDEGRTDVSAMETNDPNRPWLKDFKKYLKETEELEDISIVRWWGVSTSFSFVFIHLSVIFFS